MSLQWGRHQPAAGGRASRGPGSAHPWGTACRKDTGGHLPSRNVPEFLSAPGDLQGSGSGPAPVLPMALSRAKAMSTPGSFKRTGMKCWGNRNGLHSAFIRNFNVLLFFREVQTACPQTSRARLCSAKDFLHQVSSYEDALSRHLWLSLLSGLLKALSCKLLAEPGQSEIWVMNNDPM